MLRTGYSIKLHSSPHISCIARRCLRSLKIMTLNQPPILCTDLVYIHFMCHVKRFLKEAVCLTLNIEDDTIAEVLRIVGDNACEFLTVTLTTWHDHIVAAYSDCAIGIVRLLECGLALELGIPLNHTRWLSVR